MGWNFRKSVNLGGGFRVNFSKNGIGVSSGIKGFRVSSNSKGKRLYASIPGTGIYYTKSLGKGKSGNRNRRTRTADANANNSGNTYQYIQTVTNDYTGERRELRARTQFELNQLVQLEQARQYVNEQRQRQLENTVNKIQRTKVLNEQLKAVRDAFSRIVIHTLGVNDRINWDDYYIGSDYPPFEFSEPAPLKQIDYKLPFFKSLFMSEKKFNLPEVDSEEIKRYEARRNLALKEYLEKRSEYDKERNRKNGELVYLRKRFEASDKEAIERYVSIVLTKSEYPADFEHDFDIKYDKEKKQLTVDFLFEDMDTFPLVDRYEFNQEKDSIEEILMEKDAALLYYSNILYSVGIRTIHEVFESVYTDAVESVCFNGYIEEGRGNNSCIFAMRTTRENFEKIDLRQPIANLTKQVDFRTVRDFTEDDFVTPF